MTEPATSAEVERTIRRLLAEALRTDREHVDRLPADTVLFGPEISLSSLSGAVLLTRVHEVFGVDVAGEDLSLDSLENIATLRDFVAERL